MAPGLYGSAQASGYIAPAQLADRRVNFSSKQSVVLFYVVNWKHVESPVITG